MHRFGKAMQQQHQRRAALAGREGIEGQAGGNGDLFWCRHDRYFLILPGGIAPARSSC
jgi:hypothetical protein